MYTVSHSYITKGFFWPHSLYCYCSPSNYDLFWILNSILIIQNTLQTNADDADDEEDETNDTKIEQGSKLSTGQSVQVKFTAR